MDVAAQFGDNPRSLPASGRDVAGRAQRPRVRHRTEISQLERGLRLARVDTIAKLCGSLEADPGSYWPESTGSEEISSEADSKRHQKPASQMHKTGIRVFSFDEMHRFAKAAGRYEALVRTFTDTGMRLGEVLPLRPEDFDGETSKSAAPPMRARSSTGPRPTTARRTLAGSSPSPRLSLGCSKPGSTSTARLPSPLPNPPAAASGASVPSTATSGNRPKRPLAWTSARTSVGTATSLTYAPQESTTPTWQRSLGIASRRCWRAIPTRWGGVSTPCVRTSARTFHRWAVDVGRLRRLRVNPPIRPHLTWRARSVAA
jgi:hypothetical protein